MNLSDFVAGGYFLAQPHRREQDNPYIPAKVVTLAACMTTFFPDDWAYSWTKKKTEDETKAFESWGLSAEAYRGLQKEVDRLLNEKKVGWPNVVMSLETAKMMAQTLIQAGSTRDFRILGIGLPRASSDFFVDDEQETQERNQSMANGISAKVLEGKELEAGGTVLGFDVLGFDFGSAHSWLCNGLEKDAAEQFNILVNPLGLLATRPEAERMADYANDPKVGAEPVLWIPWIVVNYDLAPIPSV